MPEVMDVHDRFYEVSQHDAEAAHHKNLEVEASKGARFTRWWANPSTGKVFCLSEGPNKEAVRRVHRKAGHPTEEFYEVSLGRRMSACSADGPSKRSHSSTAQHSTAQHSTAQHSTAPAQHSTTQHNTTQHNTTQHNTTQQIILRCD